MTHTTQYTKALRKHLHCSRRIQNRLLKQFELSMADYLSETPSPDVQELTAAFGTPEVMASILMENVSPAQQLHYRSSRTAMKVCSSVLAALVLFSTVYLYFDKATPVVCYDELIIEP